MAKHAEEDFTFVQEIDGRVDWKKKQIMINDRVVRCVHDAFKVTIDDFVTKGKVGFEALHEKLQLMGKMHNFNEKELIARIATSPIIRLTHVTQQAKVPSYVGMLILRMLVDAKACVWYQSAVKKTQEYGLFLRHILHAPKTMETIMSHEKTIQRYQLPPTIEGKYGETLETMSVEMLLLEIESAEKFNAKKKELEILRNWLHKKQQEERSQQMKGKSGDEFAQAMAAVRAEQEDVAPSQRKKRKEH